MAKFPFYKQYDIMDCGPSCLRMVAKHYGRAYTLQQLREWCNISREGVSLLGMSDASEEIGFRSLAVRVSLQQLVREVPLPCVAHWQQRHFVVVYKTTKKHIYIADPAVGKLQLSHSTFEQGWTGGTGQGVLLLLEPTPDFYQRTSEELDKTGFRFLFSYLSPYHQLLLQLIIGLLVGSLLQLIFPFLTQSIVDVGIANQDMHFVYLILFAQLALFLGAQSVNLIRNWILLHIGARVNIALISDFLIKLMKLPIAFFDAKQIGDLLQRINDHYRIENFLTAATLNTLFSALNFLVFSIVLFYYNFQIYIIFLLSSVVYFGWIVLFLRRRRKLDYMRFDQLSENQGKLIQLIRGMQEIKLHGAEKQKRWEWERIQAKLFRVNIKSLALSQYQQTGSAFISELKNILIAFVAARAVVRGEMTLGVMLAVQYIIGQLNSPLAQLAEFIGATQDAKISLERLGEIHHREEESSKNSMQLEELPEKADLRLEKLSFRYGGKRSPKVLDDLTLSFEYGKVTAIVGTSGCGKTTLVKLLLKFYEPNEGGLYLGSTPFAHIKNRTWRVSCGVVMQDGFIFSDTIAQNIAITENQKIDKIRLQHAAKTANIEAFIEQLPLGYQTKIGQDGLGLSGGQMQRLLIARAVYKNPDYLFFDEATSGLDANNERVIMQNLQTFFQHKTVVVVAHRLSTVKNADKIIVLDNGKLVEEGTHASLTALKGAYYNLVKNQLELGN